MEEVWKVIEGYENYKVSNTGKVISLNYNRKGFCKELKFKYVYGYPCVTLNKNGKRYYAKVHRLVAQAFIPNPRNCKEVNHIDCNTKNNNVENLEWCTRLENLRHAHKMKRGNRKAIIAVYPNGETMEFETTVEASKVTGVSKSTIWRNLHHWFKNEKGFVFKYKNENKNPAECIEAGKKVLQEVM